MDHKTGTFRVSQDGEALETVFSTEALEVFDQAAKPGHYHVDAFFREPDPFEDQPATAEPGQDATARRLPFCAAGWWILQR